MDLRARRRSTPVVIGGDVKKENTTDFTFTTVGGLPTIEFGDLPA